MHLICPQCQAKNRVAESDLAKELNCGRCQTNLLPQQPVALTDASFQRYTSGTELPVRPLPHDGATVRTGGAGHAGPGYLCQA